MNGYEDRSLRVSDEVLKDHRRRSVRQYLFDNWIAIVALVLSIISILLQVD